MFSPCRIGFSESEIRALPPSLLRLRGSLRDGFPPRGLPQAHGALDVGGAGRQRERGRRVQLERGEASVQVRAHGVEVVRRHEHETVAVFSCVFFFWQVSFVRPTERSGLIWLSSPRCGAAKGTEGKQLTRQPRDTGGNR